MLFNDTVLGIVGMNVLAVVLVLARAPLFRTRLYRPMLLNVALSVAPVVVLGVGVLLVAVVLAAGLPVPVAAALEVVVVLVWLLLLPNAGYLVTELNLSHRRPGERVPEWYDVLLVLSLAMSGVLNMLFNVLLVQLAYAALRFNEVRALEGTEVRVLVVVVLVLAAFGIYLGRNIRVNTWDVLHPWSLAAKVVRHLREPGRAASAAGFTLVAGVFFGLMYLVVIGPLVRGVLLLEA
ncbi:DUF1361 domain-containing protein [Cellulomonas hominis]|uniref:DUF1361 domain-containing protein n=1 Tax=Cellulomonas hominis TaxID=156981 RepID=UPI001B90AD57|nr:DUF1361 domain-containing protein [Cellulomonas hominis]VTR76580.1 hypothetical protein CHMI_01341 [Cellulomonas hominis]